VTPVALHLRPGVREHYLRWLSEVRPDLVPLHSERFGRGSYQSRAEQHRISEVVRSVGRPVRHPSGWRESFGREAASLPAEAHVACEDCATQVTRPASRQIQILKRRPPTEQLRLL
jgi:hypothetical protein